MAEFGTGGAKLSAIESPAESDLQAFMRICIEATKTCGGDMNAARAYVAAKIEELPLQERTRMEGALLCCFERRASGHSTRPH